MLLLMLFLLSSASSASTTYRQAASLAQIKFAESQNYDGTGPGADHPEHAYKTFNNIEDALIAYADDPDTRLPEHDRVRIYQRLGRPINVDYSPLKYVHAKDPYPVNPSKYGFRESGFIHDPVARQPLDLKGIKHVHVPSDQVVFTDKEPFKLEKIRYLKESPVNIAHFLRHNQENEVQPFVDKDIVQLPEYSFSYGVHDRSTGDNKAARETLQDGVVHGYYSIMDPDGKQRTVHYTADDEDGFRAVVHRTDIARD